MKKLLPTMLAGAMAISFSTIAFSQSVGADVRTAPSNSGATVDINNNQHGVQNSQNIGDNNQSSQVIGDGNQSSQTSGDGNVTTQQGDDSQSNATTGSE